MKEFNMENITEVRNKMNQLEEELRYHNKRYYDEDAPEISDFEYDKLSRELRGLEAEYPHLANTDSPTKKVGGTVKRELRKVKHNTPVISLQDIFGDDELHNFATKVVGELGDVIYIVEKKIDGLSIVLKYESGILVDAVTRGDGVVGESVYENVLEIKSVPKKLKTPIDYLEVRGEVYMSNEAFERVNRKQESLGKDLYENPRNLAAGTLRQLDPTLLRERELDIFVFNLEISEGIEFKSHSESLSWLEKEGFPVSPDYTICTTSDEVRDAVYKIQAERWSLPYGIDGAVIKVDKLEDRQKLGSTSKCPRWAVAYKYPPEQSETIVLDIIIQVGRTGKQSPLAILKPVRLAGTTVSKATVHNQDYIAEKDIRIGDTVIIQKAGDIIPAIVSVVDSKRPDEAVPYFIPTSCAVCGEPVKRDCDKADLICNNLNCDARTTKSISYFVSKDAMNIVGFGESKVIALMEDGYIKDIGDIYSLKDFKDELIHSGIVGKEKGVSNLLKAIEESKSNELYRLITGLGIKNIGKESAKVLASNFISIDEIANAQFQDLIQLPDFGDTMANAVIEYFNSEKYHTIIAKIKSQGVNFKSAKMSQEELESEGFTSSLEGLTFVITGTLPTLKRDDAKALVEKNGGKVTNSVSKKTDYLLAGDEAGSKLTKAQDLQSKGEKIQIIDEFKFLEMI